MLQCLAKDKRVYEAGALLGHSTIALASTARCVVSIDPHDGYPAQKPRPTWELYLENLRVSAVCDRIVPVRATLQVVPPSNYEFAWADLTGQAAITETFLNHAVNCNLIAVHDYCRSGCQGATRAIDEFIQRTNPRHVSVTDTLIVIER